MNKKNYLVLILITVMTLFCSRFDDVTNVGKEVVRDIDPSQVSFDKNFKTLSLSKSAIVEKFSVPDADGSEFGVHVESFVTVGSENEENSTGYFEFRINSAVRRNFKKTKSLKDISIQFDLDDTLIANAGRLNLYLTDSLYKLERNNIAENDTLNCGVLKTDSNSIQITFTLDSLTADSIYSLCKDLKSCDTSSVKSIRNNCDSLNRPDVLSFILTNTDSSGVISVYRNAKMVVNVVPDSTEKDSVKTIKSSYGNYVVYENIQKVDSLSELPVSSFASRRTAVFKTDLSSLWETLRDDSGQAQCNEILSAAVRVWGNMEKEIDTLNFEGFVSDRLYTCGTELDSLFRYASLTKGSSSDTLLFSSEKFLQRLLLKRPSMVYIYLRINRFENSIGIWDKILWNEPEIKVILTTLK